MTHLIMPPISGSKQPGVERAMAFLIVQQQSDIYLAQAEHPELSLRCIHDKPTTPKIWLS